MKLGRDLAIFFGLLFSLFFAWWLTTDGWSWTSPLSWATLIAGIVLESWLLRLIYKKSPTKPGDSN